MDESATERTIFKYLVVWYGLYQAIHIVVNSRAIYLFVEKGSAFPAYPPSEGWSDQVTHFFIGLAGLDLVNAILSLVFVYGYLKNVSWWRTVGLVSLSISTYASLLFGYGTLVNGAWEQNLVPYLFLYVAFVPVYALFIILVIGEVKKV